MLYTDDPFHHISNQMFVPLTPQGGGNLLAIAAFIDAEWQPGQRQSYGEVSTTLHLLLQITS